MYYFIPLGIMVIGLGVIASIFLKKFPQVANLDLDNLPEEKIYKKKKEIISGRIEKSGVVIRSQTAKFLVPVKKFWGQLQLKFRIYVGKIERLLHHEQTLKIKTEQESVPSEEKEKKLNQIIENGEQNLQQGNLDQAEDLFITAIKLDPKSAPAYRGLGDTYLAKKALEEARETYKFLLHLEPDDDSVLVKLAEVAESQGDLEEAIGYYQQAVLINDSFSPRFYHLAELLLKADQPKVAKEAVKQAVELEPQNPKYLDLLIEIAIICGDKELALQAYNDLRLVNPENQKLDTFKERIYHIPDVAAAGSSKATAGAARK